MEFFVPHGHIVRKIWAKADTILLIFAGSAAEFALNKAVDWLYFTGKLPADPIGRLFSTVEYARQIIFAEKEAALNAIEKIRAIHSAVEQARAQSIPDWAYRDVLFMLIHYSIAAFERLERKLTPHEKEAVYETFKEVGTYMRIPLLPANYQEWTRVYREHLQADLRYADLTKDLFRQYRVHLGWFRYLVLLESQKLVAPPVVRKLLNHHFISALTPFIPVYRIFRKLNLDWQLKFLLLPKQYFQRIKQLDLE